MDAINPYTSSVSRDPNTGRHPVATGQMHVALPLIEPQPF